MTKNTAFIYDDIFWVHETPAGHPESKDRLLAICQKLKNSSVSDSLLHLTPKAATFSEIGLVHSQEYIDRLKNSEMIPPNIIQ